MAHPSIEKIRYEQRMKAGGWAGIRKINILFS